MINLMNIMEVTEPAVSLRGALQNSPGRCCTLRPRCEVPDGDACLRCFPVQYGDETRRVCLVSPCHSVATDPVRTLRPEFEHRELRVAGISIRRFLRGEGNQYRILQAFQMAGWPLFVENPLGRPTIFDARHRVSDAVTALNRRQKVKLIHFWVERGTQSVFWEFLHEAPECAALGRTTRSRRDGQTGALSDLSSRQIVDSAGCHGVTVVRFAMAGHSLRDLVLTVQP